MNPWSQVPRSGSGTGPYGSSLLATSAVAPSTSRESRYGASESLAPARRCSPAVTPHNGDVVPLKSSQTNVDTALAAATPAVDRTGAILQLGPPNGYAPLREYLLGQARASGDAGPKDDVLVTSGCQQAMDLVSRVLAGAGELVAVEDPVQAMREYVEIIRTTMREGESKFTGDHFTAHWTYSGPRHPDLPIVIAALGPRMLEQAGEIADGVALWMCAPSYIENEVVPRVRRGREKAGKTMDGFLIAASMAACITTDIPAALDAFRSTATVYSNLPFYRRALEGAGFAEDLAGGAPTDRMLLDLAGIGDEATVHAAIQRYRDAGANLPVIGPFNAPGSASVDDTLAASIAT